MDRDAFRHAMCNELAADQYENSRIVLAHEFFKLQIREWLEEHPEASEQRAYALVTTLMGLLQMVVIDLQTTDDANVIFETLNARGTPLLASDLIKNSILYAAGEAGLKTPDFYETYWRRFDDTWWRTEVRQGRLTRPRLDVYLNYWLTMRAADEVQSSDVFRSFREYMQANGNSITEVAQDIRDIADAYLWLEETRTLRPRVFSCTAGE